MISLERISIELTNRCRKGCSFCYNHSSTHGKTVWTVESVLSLVRSCVDGGVKAVSFGGGEPLEFEGLYSILDRLRGLLFRSVTTNGLLLDADHIARLCQSRPDKTHISIHFPEKASEVQRVIEQVQELERVGLRSGVNLLVRRSNLEAARSASRRLAEAGIDGSRVVYLPMRGQDTPTADEVASVSSSRPFQSMSCLMGCEKSLRFCSIGWDQTVAWCSYTRSRAPLEHLTYDSLCRTIDALNLEYCGHELVTL